MNAADELAASKWPTLLCIDDDPQISEGIRLRLRDYQVDVLSAYHGMHGFWLAMTERPDLIITDMRMPQGQGDYVVEALRSNSDTRQIPVIVLTGQRSSDVVQKVRQLDVQAFLMKPVRFDQLRPVIEQHIALRKRAEEWMADVEAMSE
ncbi:MAG: response regulator [Pirellulales bacterium]